MPTAPNRDVVVVCAPGSLRGLTAALRGRGWRVLRAESVRPVPLRGVPPPRWLTHAPPADLWVVTSRAVATEFLRVNPAWRRSLRRIPCVAAVGDDTAASLRALGFRRLRVAHRGGSDALLSSFPDLSGRRVVYLRSDRAGPGLARRMRRRGATVVDRVVYRTRARGRFTPSRRARWVGAFAWVLSSPSALDGFRHALGEPTFQLERRRIRAFAIGPRTASAGRRAGLARVGTSPVRTERGFTRFLVEVLGHAPPATAPLRR